MAVYLGRSVYQFSRHAAAGAHEAVASFDASSQSVFHSSHHAHASPYHVIRNHVFTHLESPNKLDRLRLVSFLLLISIFLLRFRLSIYVRPGGTLSVSVMVIPNRSVVIMRPRFLCTVD